MNTSKYWQVRWGLAVCLLMVVAMSPLQAGTVYVSTAGDDANDGLSWATAKNTVQAGLSAAIAGDQVWVAAGTYVENITLTVGVELYGGFAGTESDLAARNWAVNRTVLDGNQVGDVVVGPAGATATTRIDGFTIRNGKGSGVSCYQSAPTIANNLITGNSTTEGGGIWCQSCSPTITNNTIIGNMATGDSVIQGGGGGIYCHTSSPIVTNNTIAGNAARNGGAIYCYESHPKITNTIMAFNSSGIYGYIKVSYGTSYQTSFPTLRYNCIYGNGAYEYSGVTAPPAANANISADPKLTGLPYGSAHIDPGSPCIDAGDDTALQPDWRDTDCQPRVAGAHVDIGADESDGTLWPTAPNGIVRVSLAGDDTNDGSSWFRAKRTVQAGIDAAAAAGGEVWVATGTYPEDVVLRSYAHVYGGFVGTETLRSQRDWRVHASVLDGGGQGGNVVTAMAGEHVSTIDGFTIRNGTGSGVYCSSSSPTIANNLITANSSGGIACVYASPAISGNTIVANTDRQTGAGIYCQSSSPTITNNMILDNHTTWMLTAGGGIYCDASSPLIANNTIAGNTAITGGGVYCTRDAYPTIVNTIIAFNSSGVECETNSSLSSLRYNCVYGNGRNYVYLPDPTGTTGNISVDPKLAGWRNGHVQPGSPCIDAGDDSTVQPDWQDADGQPRIAGSRVDIGADEADGTTWPGDTNIILHVSPQGDDANDGSSWALARRTLQAALIDTIPGDQVWVAAGTYVENLVIKPGVAVYGGFAGDETSLTQRNWLANTTTLDGNHDGSVVRFPGGGAANARIDGFTLRNGDGTWIERLTGNSVDFGYRGGGIYCADSSPTIANNTITGNTVASSAVGAYGGAICCSNGSPAILNNRIVGNTVNASLYYNKPTSYGGGISCIGASPTIANNVISTNSADLGGAIACVSSSSPAIINNTITHSIAIGGGIYCDASSPAITNTIIAFNASGIYNTGGGAPSLWHSCVYGNGGSNYSGLADPTGTGGNLSTDPKLANDSYMNVHIQAGSPCADAGDDAAIQPDWLDMDGQPRRQGAHVDIGADESDGTTWPSGPAIIVRVSPAGDNANDGSSWPLAKRIVQAGIDAAAVGGGEVWVAAGTYVERITLRDHVHLYGGFAGIETDLSARDYLANASILDGNQGGSVVTATQLTYSLSTLDGFTIRNGNGSSGAGITCSNASPTIAHNTICSNTGSGIGCSSSWSTITGNTIISNTASGIIATACAPTILNNKISNNTASGIGWSYSSPVVAGNTIWANGGSGISCGYDGTATITNNTIIGNSGTSGGGIYCDYGSPVVTNTIIAFNASGIYDSSPTGTVLLRNNCVYGNAAYNYSGLADPTGTDGNISIDPRLAGIAYNNLHIQPGSPCVDAGQDAAADPGWLDMDGQPRRQGASVDIGADESDGTVWPEEALVIIRVSLAGDDANDGSSWALAKRTIQAAINAAPPGGGDIWVAGGTYSERITLRNYAHVFGGFAGKETQRSLRDWSANVTVLDASQGGSVVTANQPGLYLSTLDGFVIRNGNGTVSGSDRLGGGIYCSSASPVIRNCTITANSATYGGGIYCKSSGPAVTNCTLAGNTASQSGGGVNFASASSAASVVGCTVTNNTASSGGGITCSGSPNVEGSVIHANTASANGGGVSFGGSGRLSGNTITGNHAGAVGGMGGGVYCGSGTITGNTIADNDADFGGGICCDQGTATIASNRIIANAAVTQGGGICCRSSSPRIACNTIAGNDAYYGGGIWCYRGSASIAGNAIAGNSAIFGGGMYCYNSSSTIANDTLTGNDAYYAGAIYCQDTSATITNTIVAFNSSGIHRTGTSVLTLGYNCAYGNNGVNYGGLADPSGTNGNIAADPWFARPADPGPDATWGTADDDYGDLHLLPGSPCIDAGNNADISADAADLDGDGNTTEPLPFDLAGASRFADDPYTPDTGAGTAPIVDIGAYEHHLADANGDGYVDVLDLLDLVYSFGRLKGDADFDPTCDFNHDGAVDVMDLLDLVHNFGT